MNEPTEKPLRAGGRPALSESATEEGLVDHGAPAGASVGIVQTQFAELFAAPHELQLTNGRRLGPIRVAYETYGELSPQRDNAIFVCHALTGDAHLAGKRRADDRKSGW
ncbi:MAG: hypothetical protein ACKOJF_21835, partial [Planctomycetaceae bacterium]